MIPIANPDLGDREIQRVSSVIESGHVADGPLVREFEDRFADFCGSGHAVATSNGTTALEAALRAIGIGSGDRVVTTPLSFVASSNAIRLVGANPVFADIDSETYNLDPESVREVVETVDVDAILAVHLYGLPCDLAALTDIATEHDLTLIEDCAQAHGATYEGQHVGTIGDVGCFSFYPTKNMTTGEGGMVTTDDEAVAQRVSSYANHGRAPTDSDEHVRVGHNFRMTSLAAGIGLEQLDKLPGYLRSRRENASRFQQEIDSAEVTVPVRPDERRHAFHQYTLRTRRRDHLLADLEERGIGAAIYYPKCIHEQPAYTDHNPIFELAAAERAADSVLSIPVHPSLTESEVDQIITAVNGSTASK